MRALIAITFGLAACGSQEAVRPVASGGVSAKPEARLPSAPGSFGPSLVAIDRSAQRASEITDGEMLSDVDSCASCHPDAAAQWSTEFRRVNQVLRDRRCRSAQTVRNPRPNRHP